VSLRRLTVRVRITATVGLVFALALLLSAAFLVNRHRSGLTADLETTARLRAADVVAALEGGSLPSSIAIPVEDESFVQIIDASGGVQRSSPNIEGEGRIASFAAGPSATARTLDGLPIGDTPFRIVAQTAQAAGEPLTVYVGTSLEPVAEAVHDLVVGLTLGAPVLLAIVTAMTWVAVGRALRPVDRIRAEVGSITEHDLHRRIPLPGHHDEIGRLTETMNGMLDRLESSASRQRRFVADASHEMRSPLAAIRSQLEVDLAHPETADWRETELGVLDETLHLQRLIEDLLVLARLDEVDPGGRHEVLDLDDLLLDEARRLRVRGKHRVDASGVRAIQCVGDSDALRRAVRNILDNGERHAASLITIGLSEAGGTARIVITDDGPGVPAADRERIFERFARADTVRTHPSGGAGLGLAIARDIVSAHGGTLTLAPSDRGASFRIELPAHLDPEIGPEPGR